MKPTHPLKNAFEIWRVTGLVFFRSIHAAKLKQCELELKTARKMLSFFISKFSSFSLKTNTSTIHPYQVFA